MVFIILHNTSSVKIIQIQGTVKVCCYMKVLVLLQLIIAIDLDGTVTSIKEKAQAIGREQVKYTTQLVCSIVKHK